MRLREHVGIAAASALALGLVPVASAYAAEGDFGAIAYSESAKVASFGSGDSQASAAAAAASGCRSQGGGRDCAAYLWFENGYGSLARSGGSFGTGWGTNAASARRHALRVCREHGGKDCREVLPARTSDTPSPSPGARGGPMAGSKTTGPGRPPKPPVPKPPVPKPVPTPTGSPSNAKLPAIPPALTCAVEVVAAATGWEFARYAVHAGTVYAVYENLTSGDFVSIPLELIPGYSCAQFAWDMTQWVIQEEGPIGEPDD